MSIEEGKMNLIITRSKQERLKVRWEPCATSTPMKVVPNNGNVNYNVQRQLQIRAGSPQFVNKPEKKCSKTRSLLKKSTESKSSSSKKIKNMKSSAFFELSSSSDEDSSRDNNIRPIIKLSSTKRTQSLFLKKNLESETVKKKFENKSISNSKETRETDKSINSKALNLKSDVARYKVRTTSSFENISSSDEQSNILDKTKPTKSLMNTSTSCSANKNNSVNIETVTHMNKSNKTQERECQNAFLNQMLLKSVSQNTNSVVKDSKKSQKENSENENLSKPLKRKNINKVNRFDSIKKRKNRKINDNFYTQFMPGEDPVTPVLVFKNKINQSHQLFSDSREQECINSLDLTSVEANEATENKCTLLFAGKKSPFAPQILPHPSSQKIFNNSKRSKRLKQNLAKTCVSKNPLEGLLANVDRKEQTKSGGFLKYENHIKKVLPSAESENSDTCAEKNNENTFKKKNVRNKETEKKETRKVRNLFDPETELLLDTKSSANIRNNVNNNCALTCSGSDVTKNAESNEFSTVVKKEQKLSSENTEFKLLKELLCEKKEAECSVLECWTVNTFKCGVFKLRISSQMSCKTLHRNNYLGGVLIKGNLKMKIGNKEQELTEGDMAFVPPLTKWQATNIGECESVFYYWCGRFKS